MRMRIKPWSRAGFTIIDILVVMGMTLILSMLLLAAVQIVRPAALKAVCLNNQRDLAVAMLQFDQKHSRLPGWAEPMVPWEQVSIPVPWKQESVPVPVGWVFPLLPYLDRDHVHRRATTRGGLGYNTRPRTWPAEQRLDLEILTCPLDYGARGKPDRLSYVANSGYRDRAAETLGPYGGGDPSYDGPDQDGPASAVFLNRYRTAGSKTMSSQSLDWISKHDGAANTLLFSENIHAGRWDLHGDSTPDAPPREGYVTFNFANRLDSGPNNPLRINAAPTEKRASREGEFPGANGFHSGGVVVVFCDGHTNFISQGIDWKTWSLLFTPDGRGLHTTWPDGQGEVNVFERLVSLEQF